MAALCPLCNSKLSWWSLKSSFSCPSCHRPLKARVAGSWLAVVLLWLLADIPLYAALPASNGSNGVGLILLRSLISLVFGYLIGSLVFGLCAEVKERNINE